MVLWRCMKLNSLAIPRIHLNRERAMLSTWNASSITRHLGLVDRFQSAQITMLHSRMRLGCISTCQWAGVVEIARVTECARSDVCANVCACVRTDVCDRQNNKALRPCDQRGEAGPRNFWPLLSKPGPDSLTRLWWDNHDSARLLFRISHMFITGVRCVWRQALKYLLRGGYKIFWQDRGM